MKKLLDLYCGAGGTAMGYHHAGFNVVGVDIKPQMRYPFKSYVGDAIKFLEKRGEEFDAIHASPPCQGYSRTRAIWGREHPMLIGPTRDAILELGKPYVIESVSPTPLRGYITMLCGTMFDLRVFRHRYFETSFPIPEIAHLKHKASPVKTGRKPSRGDYMTVVGHFSDVKYARECMDIDWMTGAELAQAIPPAYTEYIGKYLMDVLRYGCFELNNQRLK